MIDIVIVVACMLTGIILSIKTVVLLSDLDCGFLASFLGALVVLFIFASPFFYFSNQQQPSMDTACMAIGHEEWVIKNSFDFCKDREGNLHYVDIECDDWWKNCKARLISVGEARVR